MLLDIAEVPRFGATALVLSEANDEGKRGRLKVEGVAGHLPAHAVAARGRLSLLFHRKMILGFNET